MPPATENSVRGSVGRDAGESAEISLRHVVVIWTALFGMIIGAFALTVLALNSGVYSASGFVTSYLHALQRADIGEALSTQGVVTNPGMGTELLGADALRPLKNVSIISDDNQGGGLHLVEYEVTIGDLPVRGSFQVLKGENRFGIFSTWSFLQSPISNLSITPMHDDSFTANGTPLTSAEGASLSANYQVFTPSLFTIAHDSAYLTATPLNVTVTQPGSTVPAILDIRASRAFVESVQERVNEFLDECVTQEVLFPTGCPFGQELSNRVESVPTWSMSEYPKVTIEPGNIPGTWVVPKAPAAAHLTVEVRSLFDGSVSTFDEDVPFSIRWVMTIRGDRIDIQR